MRGPSGPASGTRAFEIAIHLVAFSILMASALPARADSPLQRAYREEMQVLSAEKQQLLLRIEQLKNEGRRQAELIRSEVVALSEQVTRLRLENDALEENIGRAESEVQTSGDRQTLIESTHEQALATLRSHGVEIEPEAEPAAAMAALFEQGCALARRLGEVRVRRGSYFGPDGSEKQGDLLWLSRVAATSLDRESGGALEPVGAGALRVNRSGAADGARALVEGRRPALVTMFLFDPQQGAKGEATGDRTLVDTFLSGGLVMWPILALAILALIIALERLVVLVRARPRGRLVRRVGERIGRGQWSEAARCCQGERSALSRVLLQVAENREQQRDQLEQVVDEAILTERPALERFLPALNLIAVVCPLLGLLGTVTGMIDTFYMITDHGTGDPRLLSGGISEALLTTEFGLMVAIPSLLLHAFLSSRVDRALSEMEIGALGLLNQVFGNRCKRLHGAGAGIDETNESEAVAGEPERGREQIEVVERNSGPVRKLKHRAG